ncbi:hypothetical protein PPSIR1_29995 [Plesiocystis pacifica SIR-1]|uniref:Lipoprotein n=1 Tax=Plesiocystis pacifica SIR-1 TaxID=391625 RepID=A6FYX8_9BACT|nr:hypothetical protein [Plesiocystis pacifica]EDM81133.1 hypothetical protein PPSIR1_29995 [Plesiocystis pacifica SIR-1]
MSHALRSLAVAVAVLMAGCENSRYDLGSTPIADTGEESSTGTSEGSGSTAGASDENADAGATESESAAESTSESDSSSESDSTESTTESETDTGEPTNACLDYFPEGCGGCINASCSDAATSCDAVEGNSCCYAFCVYADFWGGDLELCLIECGFPGPVPACDALATCTQTNCSTDCPF